MTEINWQEVSQGLTEDRRRHDEEVEGKSVRRDAKIVEEKQWREEESITKNLQCRIG